MIQTPYLVFSGLLQPLCTPNLPPPQSILLTHQSSLLPFNDPKSAVHDLGYPRKWIDLNVNESVSPSQPAPLCTRGFHNYGRKM